MTPDTGEDSGVRVRIRGRELSFAMTEEQAPRAKGLAQTRCCTSPSRNGSWSELAFFLLSCGLAGVGLAFVAFTMVAGLVLAITFFGLAVLALSLRSARGIGGLQRGLARSMLGEEVEDPEPFAGRPGFFGWLAVPPARPRGLARRGLPRPQGAVVDPRRLRGVQPVVGRVRLPHSTRSSVRQRRRRRRCGAWCRAFFPANDFDRLRRRSFIQDVAVFILGAIFFFAAPWVMRGFVNVDRLLIRSLLGPDPMATRVRSLEQARTQTVDASAATLRRIERDLHDGTQAQLVALAMRLGMAKEKLEVDPDHVDLERVRELVDAAHRGAKEAIAELRDIARGIHPPALDIGLEGALATLAARSAVPTELSVTMQARPTPAIEAIAYFCVAELLANVAQHAQASRASVFCTQQGSWLRLVVRDDGTGGAQLTTVGSSSSGLAGLADRVHAVDGQLYLVSPPGGPTVVTVDLPLAT